MGYLNYTAYQSLKNLFIIKENTTGSILEFLYNETSRLPNGTREISLDFTALTTSARLSINPFVGYKLYIQSFRIIQLPDAPAITPPAELVSTGITSPVLATPTGTHMNLSIGTANSTIVALTDTAKNLIFKPRIIPQAQYQLQFDIQWPAGSTQQQKTMQLQGTSVAELNTNFTVGANTALVNFVGGAIDGGLKLTFGVQGVTISNIKYTVQGSPVVMADSARSIRDNYTASDTLWSRTVVNGNLVLAPNNSTAACTLSRQFTGLVVGRTYRLLIAVPNSGAPTTGTFANIIAESSATPMFTIEANLAWQTITSGNSNTNAPRSGYSQVNGTGFKEYYLIFKATTSTITINYLGAKTNANLGGRSLRHIKLIQEPVFEGYSEGDLASGYRYGFNTQQKQDDIYGPGNHNTALYWEYDTRLGRRWNLDPVVFPYISRYATLDNSPFWKNDVNGDIPFPILEYFKKWTWKIDSWFGFRDTKLEDASKFHKGLDINYSGGGNTDLGAPILATHQGWATVDNDMNGGEGMQVTIEYPGSNIRTKYMHLSKINVVDGEYVSESEIIGEMGGTAKGRPNGRDVHLHYQIERYNPETKKWEAIDPTEGKGNSKENILDPQILVDEYKSKQPSGPNQVPLDNFRRFNNIANKIIPILNSALKLIPKLLDLKP